MNRASRNPVPVFPLPELVLFPGASVPLHVFELRYRTMVRDALSADRTFALALLTPGFEDDYHGSPEFHPLGCLARVDEVEWLPNDRYNLRVVGTTRVRFKRVVAEFPYRSARVEILPQNPHDETDPLIGIEKRALLELFARVRTQVEAGGPDAARALPVLGAADPFERVVNTLCMFCGRPAIDRLGLLAEDSLIERARRVRESLERAFGAVRAARPGPPSGGETN